MQGRHRRVVWVGLVTVAWVALWVGGCGSSREARDPSHPAQAGEAGGRPSVSLPAVTTTGGPGPGPGGMRPAPTAGSWVPLPAELERVFVEVAGLLRPLVAYAPSEVPSGARLAPLWRPLPGIDRGAYGAGTENPRVTGTEHVEVRVLLQAGDGWVEIIQGLRGDLGDLPSRDVGPVDGRPAAAYRVLGTDMVVWQVGGVSYAVAATGLTQDDVVRLARGVRPCRGP